VARSALVIGGSRGIGAAVVRRLAEDGLAVAFPFANAEDTAGAVVAGAERLEPPRHLASPRSSFVIGATFTIDGGVSA